MISSDQQTISAVTRTVLCRGMRIRFPLPPARGVCLRLDATRTRTLATLLHRTESALNDGAGVLDPLTGKPIRIYRRTLNRGQMASLRRLAAYFDRHPGEGWAHVADFNGRRDGDLAKLALWDLVQTRPKLECPAERPRGWWTITVRGLNFLDGHVTVPRYQAVFCGRHLGAVDEGDRIGIAEVGDIDHSQLAASGGVEVSRAP